MSGFKKILAALLLAVILVSAGIGVFWHVRHYVMIDFSFYPRDAKKLDLRGEEISVRQYEQLRGSLPECEILWNVPFQGSAYAVDTKILTVTELSDSDIEVLDYLPELERVEAVGCADYEALLALQERRPEVDISYSVAIGGGTYFQDATKVVLTGIAGEEIELLRFLPRLKTVVFSGGENVENVEALQAYCEEKDYAFRVALNGVTLGTDAVDVELSGITEAELNLLRFLPNLKQLHILNPEASVEALLQLQASHAGVEIRWSQEVCGKLFSHTQTEIDISGIPVEDLEEVARQMTYFPNAEKLILSDCGVGYSILAEFREEHREEYKVVWTVQLGNKLTARTDDTTFMPTRERVYYFLDDEAYNLRFCEDMVCIDIGHMAISDISFVEYMPNLQYLILAHTNVQDITPLETCKNLIFLELDHSAVRDFTPLLGCTSLQDLNIGNTYPDVEPITKMTWLKNLWMNGRGGSAYKVTQALPDTRISANNNATVSGGWRTLPNYYAMRDLLGMPYMEW